MTYLLKRCVALAVVAVGLLQTPSARAFVTGSVVDNLDGTYTYSYLVNNSAGTFDIAIWSLEFPFLMPDWDTFDTLSGGDVTVPNSGWLAGTGVPIAGLSAQDFLSLDPSADVLVGATLGGFSFTSAFAPGTIPFREFSALGDSASGTTVGPAERAPSVPDGGPGVVLWGLLCVVLLIVTSLKPLHSAKCAF